jgi:hypothetical protein
MKTNPCAFLFAWTVVSLSLASAAESPRFEQQLRSDLRAILQPKEAAQKVSGGDLAYAEKWLLELKSSYPELLPAEGASPPTDEELVTLHVEASGLRSPKPRGEIWRFYEENWRGERLNIDQKILFGRFLRVVIAEAKKGQASAADIQRFDPEIQRLESELLKFKVEDELRKLQRQRKTSNKAPEPANQLLAPRTTEGLPK